MNPPEIIIKNGEIANLAEITDFYFHNNPAFNHFIRESNRMGLDYPNNLWVVIFKYIEYCNAVNEAKKPEMEKCPACHGRGEWESECCNGSGGCDCRGERVQMGTCNVCHGQGQIRKDRQGVDLRANVRIIQGLRYLGSGPRC